MEVNDISKGIIGAAIEVHRALGPGLLESIYEDCLAMELELRGVHYERQKVVPLYYKQQRVTSDLKIDLMVAGQVIVELKSVEQLLPVHQAQLLTYLRLTGCHLGLLINFNVPVLKDGIKRIVN